MKCKICQLETRKIAVSRVLYKHDVSYFFCPACGFLQTEEPFWLNEAYRNPINIYDTGVLQRNIMLSKKIAPLICLFFNARSQFLDYSGGYGLLVRLMRDKGFDFHWQDAYCQNLFARGFERPANKKTYELVTCIEAFEHFPNPAEEIQKLFECCDHILFTTEILPLPPPPIPQWWYYSGEHGQHISFYSMKTLRHLSQKFQCHLYSDGRSLHLFSKKAINPTLFKIISRLGALFPSALLKFKIKSKTESDSLMLKEQGAGLK
jgi:hypothetical protein